MEKIYQIPAFIVGIITFVICWIYCIDEYGFLIGVSIGWFPSGIVGFIVGALWPLIAVGLIILIMISQ